MPVVVVCLADRKAQYCIQDALRQRASVCLVNSLGELVGALRHTTRPIAAVIVGPRDAAGASAAPVVREIAATHAGVAIVAYCKAGIEHSPDIRALAIAGVHELLFDGEADSGAALRAVLASAGRTCAAETVLDAFTPYIAPPVRPFVECALEYPDRAVTVSAIALMLGVRRKTLFNRCIEARLPPPSELLVWCRLLLVAHIVGSTARTVESVALELEFPSDTSLRNMMKSHVGLTVSEVRQRGGLTCVLEGFRRRLPDVLPNAVPFRR